MSSPIPIPSSSRTSASPGLYVPLHRRTPSSYSNSSATSVSSSSRALSPSPSALPLPTHTPGVYTPAELLALSHSPLIATFSASHLDALRVVAPEVVQTRKQRKALAWQVRQTHRRASSRGSHSQSESEEDQVVSWRRA